MPPAWAIFPQHKTNCITQGQRLYAIHLFGPVLSTEKTLSLWLPSERQLHSDSIIVSQDPVTWPRSVTLQISHLRNKLRKIYKFPVCVHSVSVKVLVIYNPKFYIVFGFFPNSPLPTLVYSSSVGMCHYWATCTPAQRCQWAVTGAPASAGKILTNLGLNQLGFS